LKRAVDALSQEVEELLKKKQCEQLEVLRVTSEYETEL